MKNLRTPIRVREFHHSAIRLGNPFGAADEFDDLVESLGEFREVLLVQEYLVAVVGRRAVGSRDLAALGDGQEIIVAARGSDIEEIGAPARFHGLGQNLIGVVLAFAADLNLG